MLCFTSPRFASRRFTSPRFTSPRFAGPRFTSPVQSSQVHEIQYAACERRRISGCRFSPPKIASAEPSP